jgi:hypothetical protein
MSKPRLPTLDKIIGERPRCYCCGVKLRADTYSVDVASHLAEPPTAFDLIKMSQFLHSYPSTSDAVKRGYKPEWVFRLSHKATFKHEPYTVLHFWTGGFCGRGVSNGVPSFCKAECGLAFGAAAWRAGYRMKGLP